MKLRITAGRSTFEVALADTATARALHAAAPFTSRAQTWGEEVYFSTPVSAPREPGARQVVEPGTACFWCDGDAIALPFGRTPISSDERPKLASPCNVIGRLEGDPRRLAAVRPGDPITVEKA
ncbi:MAG TPA: cyclophilin-like fold protein [Burkholderiales bacterium]|nr:cyclophilin-like fold protein [Burkholderiales bacterium]